MKIFDSVVEKELYFLNQRHENSSDKYKDILLWAVGAVTAGELPLYEIKSELKKRIKVLDATEGLTKQVQQQQRIITSNKDSELSLNRESFGGLSFKESIEDRNKSILKSVFAFTILVRNTLIENRGISPIVRDEVNKYKRRDDMFYNTQTKAAREYAYRDIDNKNKDIKGWLSIAVLDNRTSVICVGLANKYYSVKQYPKREDIPNQPPRHPNCRSILIGVEYGERLKDYMTQTADDFMHRNPKTAIDFLGEEKHKLWLESNTSINNFIDLKKGALFSNEQIERKFL